MYVSIEEKKAEALARMQMLGLHIDMIRKFESEQAVACFSGPLGVQMQLDAEDTEQIRLLEEDRDILVYAVIFGEYNIGAMASCLYVSDYQEEWAYDRKNIEKAKTTGMAAYVFNVSDPELSEFGYVGIDHAMFGGLKRIW